MQKSSETTQHETYLRILDAALELFAEHGYDGTGVQEIISSVDLSKPTLYHHFGSKAGLLAALFERYANQFLDDLTQTARYKGDLPDSLDQVVDLYFRFAASHAKFCQFALTLTFLSSEHEAAKVAGKFFLRQREILEELFSAAARQHGNMRGRHKKYAISLMGTVAAHVAHGLKSKEGLTPKVRRELVQQFSHGIYS
jgi:AcrR family transcriptional regulator